MNIIENVWKLLDRRIQHHEVRPHTVDELWEVMQEEWKELVLKRYMEGTLSTECSFDIWSS